MLHAVGIQFAHPGAHGAGFGAGLQGHGEGAVIIADARVFDVYEGPGLPEGHRSVAVEVVVQPREKTLTDAEIEALSGRIVAAAEKACGARLRS